MSGCSTLLVLDWAPVLWVPINSSGHFTQPKPCSAVAPPEPWARQRQHQVANSGKRKLLRTSVTAWQRFTSPQGPAPLAPCLASEGLTLGPSPSCLCPHCRPERERTWPAHQPKATSKVFRVHVSSSSGPDSQPPPNWLRSEGLPVRKLRPLLGASKPA